jgi:hypothetical protein
LFSALLSLSGHVCIETQPENKANPKTISTVNKIIFFISLLLFLIATCHPTFYPVFLLPLFHGFPVVAVSSVVGPLGIVELPPGVVVLVVELSPEVVVLVVELSPEVVVLVSELSPEVVVLVVELSPEVVVLVSELGVVFVSEPQASVDIAVAFVVLIPVSVVVVEVDSSGHPKFLAFPNVDHFASPSSSVEVVG